MFCSFFHFLCSNIPERKCHKQKWPVLFFRHISLVVRVLVCARAIARIKWRRCLQQHSTLCIDLVKKMLVRVCFLQLFCFLRNWEAFPMQSTWYYWIYLFYIGSFFYTHSDNEPLWPQNRALLQSCNFQVLGSIHHLASWLYFE